MIINTTRLRGISLKEAVDYSLPGLETDAENWMPLNSRDPHTLRPFDAERMREIGSYLYRFNPLVARIVKLMRDFTVGQGASIYAADEQVSDVLQKFWHNDYCDMDRIVRRLAIDLSLYAHVILPVAVSPGLGDVTIGYTSPFVIKDVIPDPRNIILAKQVIVDGQEAPFEVVHVDRQPDSMTYGYRTGNCFYMAINCAGEDLSGVSDVLPSSDFADCLDQLIFSSLERMNEEMKWVWEITMEGASEDVIKEKARELEENPPNPGSFQVHNEGVTWKPLQSGIKASNVRDEANLIRDYALGGMGVPSFFFNDSEMSARQAAEAAASPAYQTLSSRQAEIETFLHEIANFVIDQKILHGQLPRNVNREFQISFPKISMRDLQRIAGALDRITKAMSLAKENNWVSDDIGTIVFRGLINQLGLGVPTIIDMSPEDGQLPNVTSYRDNADTGAHDNGASDTWNRPTAKSATGGS